jgi:Flp pilus assembly protein TadG
MVVAFSLMSAVGTTRTDQRGVAALEFALIASALLILLLGGYDIGNAIQQRMLLQQALRAGGQYAMSFPTQTDPSGSVGTDSGIVQAINQALPANWLSQEPTVTFSPDPGHGPPYYITMSATRPFSAILLGTLLPDTTSGTYVVRVQ